MTREPIPITLPGLMDIGYEPRRGMITLINGTNIGLQPSGDQWEVRIFTQKSSILWPNKFSYIGQVKSLISLLLD